MMPAFHMVGRCDTGRMEQVFNTSAPMMPHTIKEAPVAPEKEQDINKIQQVYNG